MLGEVEREKEDMIAVVMGTSLESLKAQAGDKLSQRSSIYVVAGIQEQFNNTYR